MVTSIQRGLAIVVALLCATATSYADDIEDADRLFTEGKALLDTDLAKACNLFEQSLAKNPQAIGTLLNVARCDQKLGRIASAVARFTEARDRAKEQKLDVHFQTAQSQIDELSPRLPHLSLQFTEAPLPDTKVVIHDKVIPLSTINNRVIADLPVDPGEHTVVVSAPGYLPFQTKIQIREAEKQSLSIPPLSKSVTVKSSRRSIGKITAITGVAFVAGAVGLGFFANKRYDDARPGCVLLPDGRIQCPTNEYANTKSARTIGAVGTVVGIVGGVAVLVGGYLYVTGPKDESARRVSLVPSIGPDQVGFTAVGRF
jgi:hypothetical protein